MKKILFFIFVLISLFCVSCSKKEIVEEKYQGIYFLSETTIDVSRNKIKFLESGKEYNLRLDEDTIYFKRSGKKITCEFGDDILTIDSKVYIKETIKTTEARVHFNSFLNMDDFLIPDGRIENTLEKDNTYSIFVENEYLSPDDYVSYLDRVLIPLGYIKITTEEYYGKSMGETSGINYEKYDGDLYKIAFSNSNEKKQCTLQCRMEEEEKIRNVNVKDFKKIFHKNTNLDIDLGDKVKGIIGLFIIDRGNDIYFKAMIDTKVLDVTKDTTFDDVCDSLEKSLPNNFVRVNRYSKKVTDGQDQETVFVLAEKVDGKLYITTLTLTDAWRYSKGKDNEMHGMSEIVISYNKRKSEYQSYWNACEYKINDYIGRRTVNIPGYPGNSAYIVDKLENYGSHITYYLFLCDNRWYDNWYKELAKVGFTKIDGGFEAIITTNESKYKVTIEIKEFDTYTEFSFTSYVTK